MRSIILLSIVASVLATGCGGSDESGDADGTRTQARTSTTEPAAQIPRDAVAVVRDIAVREPDVEHWLVPSARAKKMKRVPPKGSRRWKPLKNQVMQFLLQNQWVRQEADRRRVTVTELEVEQAFEKQKRQAFPSDGDYRKFLASQGFTREDILMRVELELLSNKLQKVAVGTKRGRERQKALDEFVKDFRDRWQEQTRCAPTYRTPECGRLDLPEPK